MQKLKAIIGELLLDFRVGQQPNDTVTTNYTKPAKQKATAELEEAFAELEALLSKPRAAAVEVKVGGLIRIRRQATHVPPEILGQTFKVIQVLSTGDVYIDRIASELSPDINQHVYRNEYEIAEAPPPVQETPEPKLVRILETHYAVEVHGKLFASVEIGSKVMLFNDPAPPHNMISVGPTGYELIDPTDTSKARVGDRVRGQSGNYFIKEDRVGVITSLDLLREGATVASIDIGGRTIKSPIRQLVLVSSDTPLG